jgi:hypothetical protein
MPLRAKSKSKLGKASGEGKRGESKVADPLLEDNAASNARMWRQKAMGGLIEPGTSYLPASYDVYEAAYR